MICCGWTAIDQALMVWASGTLLRSTMSPRGGSSGLASAAAPVRSVKSCSMASRATMTKVTPTNSSIISISRW